MDIKIGDKFKHYRGHGETYQVIAKGSSFGYDIKYRGTVSYDVSESFIENGLDGLDRSELRYKIKSGDIKTMNNGETCEIVRKEENGSIILRFENNKVLKFISVYAFTRGYATSERSNNKEYDIEIGDEVNLSGGFSGIITDVNYKEVKILVDDSKEFIWQLSCLGSRGTWVLTKSMLAELLIGRKRDAEDGLIAEITGVNGVKDITVTFSNGNIRHIAYKYFAENKILRSKIPDYTNARVYQKHEKMYATVLSNTGKYKDCFKVRFDDGTVVVVQRKSFLNGKAVKNPKTSKPIEIGECHKQTNGLYATVISINENNKSYGDIKLSNGVILHNYCLKRVRRGNLPKNDKALKSMNKYSGRVDTINGFYYEVLDRDDKVALIRWNDFYLETRCKSSMLSIKTPLIFRSQNTELRYGNIKVDKIESDIERECFYIYGTCTICGKYVKVESNKQLFGHNCYNDVNGDYFGLDVDVIQLSPYKFKFKYKDNTITELTLYGHSHKLRKVAHSSVRIRNKSKLAYIDKTDNRVLDMYFDEVKKRYICVTEKDKVRHIVVLNNDGGIRCF